MASTWDSVGVCSLCGQDITVEEVVDHWYNLPTGELGTTVHRTRDESMPLVHGQCVDSL